MTTAVAPEPKMPIRYDCPVPCALGRINKSGNLSKTGPMPSDLAGWWDGRTPWRVFGQFALVYVVAGTGRYADARGQNRQIVAGDIILVFPDLGHRYGPTTADEIWHEVYLVFEGSVFDHWLAQGVMSEHQPVHHLEPVALWRRRMTEVIGIHPPGRPETTAVEVCRLQQLLADLLATAGEHHYESIHHADWLAHVRRLLEQGRSAQQVAAAVHLSYAAFRKRFTQWAGVSPTRYQARRLIDRACELIHTGGLTDKQIAAELGFYDASHFSRRFKEVTGRSPRAYRHHLP